MSSGFFKNGIAFLIGIFVFACLLSVVEYAFRLNQTYGWWKKRAQVRSQIRQPYDLSNIDLKYLEEIVQYSKPHDYDDPDDYDNMTFERLCKDKKRVPLVPYWIGVRNCAVKATLRKTKSKRIVYSIDYIYDDHRLRAIPAANKGSSNFWIFLGCSFTFGEGVDANKIFPNLITKRLGPANAFNFGMVGFGPNHVVRMLEQDKVHDIRLNAVTSSHLTQGIAIYTFIDDHIRRSLVSRTWLQNPVQSIKAPFYELDSRGQLINKGNAWEGRPFWTRVYHFLAPSALFDFYGVDLPIVGEEQLETFAALIEKIKILSEEKLKAQNFIFSIYPGQRRYVARLKPLLEKRGIQVFDFSQMDLRKLLKNHESIFGNVHPSEEAHRFYSDLFVHEYKKQRGASNEF